MSAKPTDSASGNDPLRTKIAAPNGAGGDAAETVNTAADPDRTAAGHETAREADTSVDPARQPGETATYHPPASFDPDRTGGYTPSDQPATPAPRRYPSFPGYEVLGVLGRGGMGVVYKARQIGLDRLVALKVILAGPQASEAAVARFRAEAQAVARFQHPNLVQVFEVGETAPDAGGMPFFTLEFVAGGTLEKKVARTPQPPREAAAVVEKLARAMQYAHERGIAHRDLKPANVLLTTDGAPKVTDFGLAKELEGESGQTQSGQIMGTPSYMAPEQAEGRTDIGAPADIYALGGILYDLLTGRPPFSGSSVLDTLEMVRTREPLPPSTLTGKLPRDIETICLKCLQKDIGKRYASAGQLADDLQRFLDGRPILARPVGRVEKAWRWARRNPTGATAVLLGLAMLIVPTILSVLLYFAEGRALENAKQANAAKLIAQAEEAKAKRERDEKEVARAAEEKAKGEKSVALNEVLTSLLESVNVMRNRGLNVRASLAPAYLDMCRRIAKRLTDLRAKVPDVSKDSLDKRTEAAIQGRVGSIYLTTGQVALARDELSKALPALKAVADANPTDVLALSNYSNVLNQLGDAERRSGQEDQTRGRYAAALAIRQARLPLFDALFKERKVSQDDVTTAYYQVADSFGLVAGAELRLGDPVAAIQNYLASDKAFAALKTAGFLDVRLKRSEIQRRLGEARMYLRDFDAADKHYRAAIDERETLLKITPESAGFGLMIRGQLGQARLDFGDFLLTARKDVPAARAEYRAALRLFAAEAKKEPDFIDLQRLVASAHYRLGYVARTHPGVGWLFGVSDPAAHFAECLRLREPLAKIDPSDTTTRVEWMLALARAGKLGEAEKLADQLAAVKELDQQVRFQVICGYSVIAGQAADAELAKKCREKAFASLTVLVRGWKAKGQLELDPDLDGIRTDARFGELVKE